MNLILLFKKDLQSGPDKVCLKGRRHKHVFSVHKGKVGDKFLVGMENGRMGYGQLTAIDKNHLEMKVALDQKPPTPLAVTLILALPRPLMLKRILFAATSMGVKRIVLLHSQRVEKSFWNSSLLKEEKYKEPLILGLEQAKDTVLPEVIFKDKFKPFVEDELPDMIKETLALVAHPEASRPCPSQVKKSVTLAVGPEGGFIPYELDKFISLGFKPVSLGERILRVEDAVVALISKLF